MCHHPTSGAHYQREYHTCIAATGKASIGGDGDENKDCDDDDNDHNQNQRAKNTKTFHSKCILYQWETYGVEIWSGADHLHVVNQFMGKSKNKGNIQKLR